MPLGATPKTDAVEIDELCISKRRNLWLWLAVSRYTGQILAVVVGDRSWETLELLWYQVPERYRRCLVYTDRYNVYPSFFAAWQLRLCDKGDGGTCAVEGVNNALRNRCGALVRHSAATLPRSPLWLWRRLFLACHAHNTGGLRRFQRRLKQRVTTQPKH